MLILNMSAKHPLSVFSFIKISVPGNLSMTNIFMIIFRQLKAFKPVFIDVEATWRQKSTHTLPSKKLLSIESVLNLVHNKDLRRVETT